LVQIARGTIFLTKYLKILAFAGQSIESLLINSGQHDLDLLDILDLCVHISGTKNHWSKYQFQKLLKMKCKENYLIINNVRFSKLNWNAKKRKIQALINVPSTAFAFYGFI